MDPIQLIVQAGALGLLTVVLLVGGPRVLGAFERISGEFVAALAAANKTTRRALRLVRTLTGEVREVATQLQQLAGEFRDFREVIEARDPPAPGPPRA